MTNLLTGSPRIRRGTWTALDMTADYEVKRFAVQSDQRRQWFNPVDPFGTLSLVAEVVEGFDGTRGGQGGIEFAWSFVMLTPLQTEYLRNTLFAGNFSDDFTCMTWDRGYGWRVVNCLGQWNEPAQTAEAPRGWPGYTDVRIDFVNGTIAPLGNALELENGLQTKLETGDFVLLEG